MTKRRNPLDRYALDIAPGELTGSVCDRSGVSHSVSVSNQSRGDVWP